MTIPTHRALWWPLVLAVVITMTGALYGGLPAAVSGALGSGIIVVASSIYVLLLWLSRPRTPTDTIRAMLRAEAAKIITVVLGLWWVLSSYQPVVHLTFFSAFILTVLVQQVAMFTHNNKP